MCLPDAVTICNTQYCLLQANYICIEKTVSWLHHNLLLTYFSSLEEKGKGEKRREKGRGAEGSKVVLVIDLSSHQFLGFVTGRAFHDLRLIPEAPCPWVYLIRKYYYPLLLWEGWQLEK